MFSIEPTRLRNVSETGGLFGDKNRVQGVRHLYGPGYSGSNWIESKVKKIRWKVALNIDRELGYAHLLQTAST